MLRINFDPKQCKQCGKTFERTKEEAREFRKKQYCGYSCAKTKRGYWIDRDGYKILENQKLGRKVREHRLVMEQHIGRPLRITEHVHHIDGNRTNNDINNLVLVKNGSEHIKKYHLQNSLKNIQEFNAGYTSGRYLDKLAD